MKKVDVSYDAEEVHYKHWLQAVDTNTDLDFEFDRHYPITDFMDASVIQTNLTKK
jgi:hypothetical protein